MIQAVFAVCQRGHNMIKVNAETFGDMVNFLMGDNSGCIRLLPGDRRYLAEQLKGRPHGFTRSEAESLLSRVVVRPSAPNSA
jgi:hypothetical protein